MFGRLGGVGWCGGWLVPCRLGITVPVGCWRGWLDLLSFCGLSGWLVGSLVIWLVCRLHVWSVTLAIPRDTRPGFGVVGCVWWFGGWLFGWCVGLFVCWLVDCAIRCCFALSVPKLVGWLPGWLVGCLLSWLVWLVGCFVDWSWLRAWLFPLPDGCKSGWLVNRLARLVSWLLGC